LRKAQSASAVNCAGDGGWGTTGIGAGCGTAPKARKVAGGSGSGRPSSGWPTDAIGLLGASGGGDQNADPCAGIWGDAALDA